MLQFDGVSGGGQYALNVCMITFWAVCSYKGQKPGIGSLLGIHSQSHSLVHGTRPGTQRTTALPGCMYA